VTPTHVKCVLLAVPDNLAVARWTKPPPAPRTMRAWPSARPASPAGRASSPRDAPPIAAALGLDADSRIAIIASEGTTDPEVYRRLTGRAPKDDSLESDYVA
jgi:hypothetical protein